MESNEIMESFLRTIGSVPLTLEKVRLLPPAVLAYVGDAVYEVYVRMWVASTTVGAIQNHHRKSVRYVQAVTQAMLVKSIWEQLAEEEQAVVKRGRNVKSGSVPKNASVVDYRMATGFEALIGYLYLMERHQRVAEIIALGLGKMIEAAEVENQADGRIEE